MIVHPARMSAELMAAGRDMVASYRGGLDPHGCSEGIAQLPDR